MIKKILLTLLILLLIFAPVCADTVNGNVRIKTSGGGGGGGGAGGTTTTQNQTQNQTVFISYPPVPYVPLPQQPQQEVQETQPETESQSPITGALLRIPAGTDSKSALVILFVSLIAFYMITSYLRENISRQSRRQVSRTIFKRLKR
jgi:hypothetical protein